MFTDVCFSNGRVKIRKGGITDCETNRVALISVGRGVGVGVNMRVGVCLYISCMYVSGHERCVVY